ncbi:MULTISPECIES: hypothetical protein [Actinosynnema]|uniref:hypothetical protein n=1 Tax=Actinosynnema TaxID=40566 RepID=UPI0020A35F86|nr:hypothetical protein [Actinosynnema pretiosum]
MSENQHADGPESAADARAADFLRRIRREAREQAPRVFAIVYEIGDREDCEVAAYGLAFPDRAETTAVDDGHHTRSESAEHALALYARFAAAENLRTHLLWLDGSGSGHGSGECVMCDLAASARR